MDTIQRHLRTYHTNVYVHNICEHKLKGWETLGDSGLPVAVEQLVNRQSVQDEPFTVERFQQLLVYWVVSDDQVLHFASVFVLSLKN